MVIKVRIELMDHLRNIPPKTEFTIGDAVGI